MKKYLLLLLLAVATFAGCKKEEEFDAAAQASKDDTDIQAYIKANAITDVTKDATGFYYKIISQGNGNYPTASSSVTVNYNGKLLNGSQFDAGTAVTFPLSGVIRGWTLGLQRVKSSGRILLLIPSGLGYGNSDQGAIPKNSVLVFTIDLLSIN